MTLGWILSLVLFCILHLVLAIMLLQDLADRKRVLGGAKSTMGYSNNFYYFPWLAGVLVLSPSVFLK